MSNNLSFSLSQEQVAYLVTQMNQVSRSFALVVPNLETPLDNIVATAYLLCRVVDNIEDCTHGFATQSRRFDEFQRLLAHPSLSTEILTEWSADEWPGLTEAERHLMSVAGGSMLWQIYASIPEAVRDVVHRWTGAMADGMRQVEDPAAAPRLMSVDGVSMLADEYDYNLYCYFVAGTVGHMVTELAIEFYELDESVSGSLLSNCEAFGRGLQKTNIVKDFAKDLPRGICYLPETWLGNADYAPLLLQGAPIGWKSFVIEDVLGELRDATNYLRTLPFAAAGFRRACLMSLLPAYETLLLAAKRQDTLFTAQHRVKISRFTMAKLMQQLKSMVTNNENLSRYSEKMDQAIRAHMTAPVSVPLNQL